MRPLEWRDVFLENTSLTEIEQRIIALVSHETGMKREHIKLTSRLVHDFGMDGDDAVECFEKFSTDFNAEIAPLWNHWHEHFGPEAVAPSMGYVIILVASVILGDILHSAFRGIPSWAWMILLIIVYHWVHHRLFFDREGIKAIPVTVGDLMDAAKAGTWVMHYDNSDMKFRTFG